jgi:16S rRNA processing protein RimM
MPVSKDLKRIGYIAGTHGIKGDLKLVLDEFVTCDFDFTGTYLFLEKDPNIFVPFEVVRLFQKKNLIISLQELNDINEAQAFVKKTCFIRENEFDNYFSELVDYKQYVVCEGQKHFGPVIDVMFNGAYELFKVNINGKQVWVPNVERYVVAIDDATRCIEIIDSDVLI